MFNVFLPKLLESRTNSDVPQTLEQSLWDVMIFTIGGCPGAIVSFLFSFSPETHILTFNFSHVDWCLPNRIEAGSKMVISRKHLYYCFFLCVICSRQVEVGCYFEHCGHKSDCDGGLDIHNIFVY